MKLLITLLWAFAALIGAFLTLLVLYILMVMLPVSLYHEGSCQQAGYPRQVITLSLGVYCTTAMESVPLRSLKWPWYGGAGRSRTSLDEARWPQSNHPSLHKKTQPWLG